MTKHNEGMRYCSVCLKTNRKVEFVKDKNLCKSCLKKRNAESYLHRKTMKKVYREFKETQGVEL